MFKYYILAVLSAFFVVSCSNEIDLNDDFIEYPVTYGVLNPNDTVQYIRIERLFGAIGQSALEVAKNPDSIYYANITVILKDETNSEETELEKIDGNEFGLIREEGVFAESPNYLYRVTNSEQKIIPGRKYSLIVLDSRNDTLTSATIEIIRDINIYIPNASRPVKFAYISFFNTAWEGGTNAGYFDLIMEINIKERDINGDNKWKDTILYWKVGQYIGGQNFRFQGLDFYRFLGDNLTFDPDIRRKFINFNLIVRGVGRELKEYIDILNFDKGISSSQQLPIYTNMSYGFGVFSSLNTTMKGPFTLEQDETIDSLKSGIYTRQLFFE